MKSSDSEDKTEKFWTETLSIWLPGNILTASVGIFIGLTSLFLTDSVNNSKMDQRLSFLQTLYPEKVQRFLKHNLE